MHFKASARKVLEELHACGTFRSVVAEVKRHALGGVRTPFSKEAVQKARQSNAVGIHTLLD